MEQELEAGLHQVLSKYGEHTFAKVWEQDDCFIWSCTNATTGKKFYACWSPAHLELKGWKRPEALVKKGSQWKDFEFVKTYLKDLNAPSKPHVKVSVVSGSDKCPACGSSLVDLVEVGVVECSNNVCDYSAVPR